MARHFLLSLCSLACLCCGSAAAQETLPLGTLLFSPAERAQIVANREPVENSVPEASTLKYQGVVRRSSGNSTVWVNEQALPPGSPKAPALRDVDAILLGKQLRVGESVQTNGQRQDITAPGALTVRR